MCGRYTNKKTKAFFQDQMGLEFSEKNISWAPSYNISPTSLAPVTILQQPRTVGLMQFGYTPPWMKDTLFNAASETLMEKKTFMPLMEKGNRCIVYADGYYEWKTEEKGKHPYLIYLKDRELFSFAGLWGKVKDKAGNEAFVFYIITTSPNQVLKDFHHRMPVIFSKEDENKWMNTGTGIDDALSVLKPYPDDEFMMHKVSKEVGNSRINHEGLVDPV